MDRAAVKVLLIEDNPSDVLLLRSAFEEDRRDTFVLTHVERLSEGLQNLARADFDVVLLDLNLPDSSSLETFERLHHEAPELPVVVFSGNTNEEDAIRAVQAGAQDYLVKGLGGFSEVPRTVRHAIERQKLGKSLRENEVILRAILNNVPITIFAIDRKGQFTLSEGKGLEMTGLKPGENVGASAFELYARFPFFEHTGSVVLGQDVMRSAMAGEMVNAVSQMGGVYFDNYIGPLRDADGNVDGIVGVAIDITERRRAELEQHASLEIAQGLAFSKSMEEFISLAHVSVRRVIKADNLFVALHDAASGNFQQVYWVDQYDAPLPPSKWEKTLTSYIFRTRQPILFDKMQLDQLLASGEVEWVGTRPLSLLGVPLIASGETIGVLVVQDYHQADLYSERDLRFIISIAGQVAQAVQRKRAEEALRTNEERFRALIENGLDYISLLDERGNLLWESPSATQMLGYGFNEFLGRNLFDLIHPDDLDGIRRNFAELVQEPGAQRPGVFRLKRADGSWRWVEAIGSNFLHLPAVGAIVINYRDITDRKQAEEDLRQSEMQFRTLFESAPIGIGVTDMQGNFLAFNDAILQPGGYSRADIEKIGGVAALYDDPAQRAEALTLFQKQGFLRNYEVRFKRKVGEPYDALLSLVHTTFEGRPGIQALVQDITERKQVEEELRQSEARYRQLFESNPQPMWVYSLETLQFLAVNDAAVKHYGYSRDEFLGMTIADIRPPEDLPRLHKNVASVTEGMNEAGIWRHLKKDGSLIEVEITSHTLDFDGRRAEIVLAQDVSGRRRAEREIRRRNEDLSLLDSVNQALNRGEDLAAVINLISEGLKRIFHGHGATIYLFGADRRKLISQNMALPADMAEKIEKMIGVAIPPLVIDLQTSHPFRQIFETHRIQVINEPGKVRAHFVAYAEAVPMHPAARAVARKAMPAIQKMVGVNAELLIPLISRSDLFGVMDLGSSDPFVEDDIRRMEAITAQLTVAIQRKQAEDALRQAEEKYRNIFENAVEAITQTTLDGRYITANPATARILGYDSTEDLVARVTEIERQLYVNPRRRAEFIALMEENGSVSNFESEVYRRDGTTVWISENSRAVRDELGNLLYYEGSAEDITARKRTEESLRRSEENLNRAQQVAHVGNWMLDIASGALEWSDETYRIFGLPIGERMDLEHIITRVPLDDLEMVRDRWAAALTGAPYDAEHRIVLANGEVRWVREIAEVTFSSEGRAIMAFGTVQDITERKQTEDEINHRISELEAIYENGLQINRLMEPRDIGERLIRTLSEKLEWHHVTVRLYSPESGRLEVLAFSTPGEDHEADLNRFNRVIKNPRQGLSGWVFTHGEVVRCPKVREDARYAETYPGIQSGMYIPLRVGERVIGVVSVESEREAAFTEDDEHLLITLCNQTAIAIYNAGLFFELQSELIERRLVEEQIRQFNVDLEKRVTERTAEIEATRQRLKLATSAGEIGVWEYLPLEDYLYWDNQVCVMYGVAPLENANAVDLWVNMLHPEDREAALRRHKAALEGEGRYFSEYRILRSDGAVRHIVSQAIILRDEVGHARRMVGVNMDVTDQKRAEEALRLVNMEMERALRLKDEFLASMSHELRTPLNAILGISESLAEQVIGPLNPKQQKYIQTVMESGQHLLELINDILDLAKINAGKVEMDMHKVNVSQMAQSSLRMVREMAQKKEQDLSLDIDKSVTVIWGDERRLKQMLVNLMSNAVKFTPRGGRIGLEVRGDEQNMILNFTVWDTGIGIDSKDLHLLFQPFVQLDPSLARSAQGTGLGLMLVSQMARLHGGSVSVQSEPGKGSRFTISIPWVVGTPQTGSLNPAKLSPPNAPSNGEGARPTILLVEDTEAVSMLTGDYLGHHGYNVLVARNGFEGIAQARQFHPDLILMDVMMPEMDGLETTRRIRAEPGLEGIPIIALTALAMPGDRERCLEAGMNGYLSKPIQNWELLKVLDEYLNQGEKGNNNA